jgi:hypothetical protein
MLWCRNATARTLAVSGCPVEAKDLGFSGFCIKIIRIFLSLDMLPQQFIEPLTPQKNGAVCDRASLWSGLGRTEVKGGTDLK